MQQQMLKNGDVFRGVKVPEELTAQVPKGNKIRFSLEECGEKWAADFNPGECDLEMERRGSENSSALCVITVQSKVQTPARIELSYGGRHASRLIVYTIAAQQNISPLYPNTPAFALLRDVCKARGIVITDYHIHIRGGMTPELAAQREEASGIRSSAMENFGREWEIFDNAKLRLFADNAKKVICGDHSLPTGIQVNDRDWFTQIDNETRSRFDYILADTMIMGKLPSGRDNRLWIDQVIQEPEVWMEKYIEHNLRILGEPITILANPTYLPKEIAGMYDVLWTDERMEAVIAKAVSKGIALEIQAGSPFPRPKFMKMAKNMGAKFSFGTNNFDPTPKDLTRWLDAIEWLDLRAKDIFTLAK